MESSSSVVNERNTGTMTTTSDPEVFLKALRLLPEFDGNPNVLTRFVRLCDEIVGSYEEQADNLGKLFLVNGILNKITGPAARTINSNGIPESWKGIRGVLINNFTDQRDETTLYNDLALQTQGSNTPQEFYDKCQTLFSTIMTYVTLHETIGTTIEAKRNLYRKLTMQSFVRGLKEPLGSRIRCMRPDTIEKALEYVQEELNTMYLQGRNESLPKISQNASNYKPPVHTPMPSAFAVPRPFVFPVKYPNIPAPPPRFNNNFPQRPQLHQPMHMPTRTQQMFGARLPNYNPQGGAFRMPPKPHFNYNPNANASKPMSGVSHFTPRVLPPSGHDWTKHGNPPPTNYFKTRDVNVNECTSYDDYTYYYDNTDYNTDSYYTVPDSYNAYDHSNAVPYQYHYEELQEPEPWYGPVEEPAQPSTSSKNDDQDFQLARNSKSLK